MAAHCPACGEKLGPDEHLIWGGYELDESGFVLSGAPGQTVRLTGTTAALAATLMRASGRVLSKELIFGMMYAARPEADWPDDMKIVDIYVCKLRKAAPWFALDTIWGRGYCIKTYGTEITRRLKVEVR